MIRLDAPRMTAALRKHQARLDAMARELGQTWTCVVAVPEGVSDRLHWLDRGGPHRAPRPLFVLTPRDRTEIQAAVRSRFLSAMVASPAPSMLVVMTVAANTAREIWVRRLTNGGGDQRWEALAPRYAAWKRRRGLDPRIGVAHAQGGMLDALSHGLVVVRKTG